MATSVNTFDFIPASQRIMYTTAFDAITQLELWSFMRNFTGESFMFSSDPQVGRIHDRIVQLGYGGHSGCSFGCTMRAMEYIGKNGLDKFEQEYSRQTREEETQRPQRQEIRDRDQQYLAQ
jgi:hypothetical protein